MSCQLCLKNPATLSLELHEYPKDGLLVLIPICKQCKERVWRNLPKIRTPEEITQIAELYQILREDAVSLLLEVEDITRQLPEPERQKMLSKYARLFEANRKVNSK
jgi:protein-arginine kinase activator protein McsA